MTIIQAVAIDISDASSQEDPSSSSGEELVPPMRYILEVSDGSDICTADHDGGDQMTWQGAIVSWNIFWGLLSTNLLI